MDSEKTNVSREGVRKKRYPLVRYRKRKKHETEKKTNGFKEKEMDSERGDYPGEGISQNKVHMKEKRVMGSG